MSLRARQSGFTLLEILLSVSLLALLVGLAYGSIRVATKASTSGERLIERTEEMRTVQQFMRRQISQMMSAPFDYVVDDGGEKRFEGSEDAIQFVAPMPGYLSHGGPHVQRLEIVRGDRGRQLQFRFAQLNGWDPEAGFPDDAEPVVLIDGIRDGGFSFRRLDENGELPPGFHEYVRRLNAAGVTFVAASGRPPVRLKLMFPPRHCRNRQRPSSSSRKRAIPWKANRCLTTGLVTTTRLSTMTGPAMTTRP